jgi:hypothetical protein
MELVRWFDPTWPILPQVGPGCNVLSGESQGYLPNIKISPISAN